MISLPSGARPRAGEIASCGERNRWLLRGLRPPRQILVLDSDQRSDIETLELLEALVQDYAGRSSGEHDRAFLDNVVKQNIAFEGEALEGVRGGQRMEACIGPPLDPG